MIALYILASLGQLVVGIPLSLRFVLLGRRCGDGDVMTVDVTVAYLGT